MGSMMISVVAFCKWFRFVFSRDRRGNVAVEFALISIPLLLFVLGTIEVGHLFFRQHQLSLATSTVARLVFINPNNAVATVESGLEDDLPEYFMEADRTITVDQQTIDGEEFVNINVTFDYTAIIPMFSGVFPTIESTARVADPSQWLVKDDL